MAGGDSPRSSRRPGTGLRRPAGETPVRPRGALTSWRCRVLGRIVAAHGGRIHRELGTGFGVLLRWPQYQRVNHGGVA